jgi:hypothetical protein
LLLYGELLRHKNRNPSILLAESRFYTTAFCGVIGRFAAVAECPKNNEQWHHTTEKVFQKGHVFENWETEAAAAALRHFKLEIHGQSN